MPCQHAPIPGTDACPTCPPPAEWRLRGLCRQHDPDLWFPNLETPHALVNQARAICAECPVRPYCLEDGWAKKEGVWGGWTPNNRRDGWKLHGQHDAPRALIRSLAATIPARRRKESTA